MFSANRFGSTYALSAATEQLNGSYVQTPQDVVVTETNPAPADDTRKKRRIPHLERGIGLHILTDLAGRYHGSCTQEVRDGQFTVSIALQLPENQGETEEA